MLSSEAARAYTEAVLTEAGFCEPDATLCADLLVETSLRGVDSHGVTALLPVFADQARHGVGRPEAAPAVVAERGAIAAVHGQGASGPRTARVALEVTLRLAARFGLGAAAARDVGYLGALWWSVMPAAEQELIGLAAVNAAAWVAPFGGREPLHGTNPIAVAIPLEPDPIVLDMRTNAFRMADYWESVRTGAPLPAGGLMRPDGSPLTDAGELDEAVYLPLAGPKGYGLALVVDVLTAGLAGGLIGRELAPEMENDGCSAFFLAVEPGFFGPSERFSDAVARLAGQVHATAPLDPSAPVRLPGERTAAERRRRLEQGIPTDPALWRHMQERLDELEISTPAPDLQEVA
jgi:LDH2 family malate/lactate/ureidoglycolate dehydrogenase